jgi:hypothetical protein
MNNTSKAVKALSDVQKHVLKAIDSLSGTGVSDKELASIKGHLFAVHQEANSKWRRLA